LRYTHIILPPRQQESQKCNRCCSREELGTKSSLCERSQKSTLSSRPGSKHARPKCYNIYCVTKTTQHSAETTLWETQSVWPKSASLSSAPRALLFSMHHVRACAHRIYMDGSESVHATPHSEMYLVSIALRLVLSVSSRVDNVIGMHRGRVTQSGMWRFDWSEEGFIVHLSSAHSDARHFTAYALQIKPDRRRRERLQSGWSTVTGVTPLHSSQSTHTKPSFRRARRKFSSNRALNSKMRLTNYATGAR
jgi:hypothetical protein